KQLFCFPYVRCAHYEPRQSLCKKLRIDFAPTWKKYKGLAGGEVGLKANGTPSFDRESPVWRLLLDEVRKFFEKGSYRGPMSAAEKRDE
ncbi:MAG: hypothetical protein AB1458_14685, partial [Bacteroidota bacterium]